MVIIACVCWAAIITKDTQREVSASTDVTVEATDAPPLKLHQWKDAIFLLILALGILERLSRLANLVSIERDWVPTMVSTGTTENQQPQYDLSRLNAVMSRIDLICKLGSPIAISAFMSATNSPRQGASLLIGLNFLTWPFEYWTARLVWQANEQLQEEKVVDGSEFRATSFRTTKKGSGFILDALFSASKAILSWVVQYGRSLRQYFATEVWMPSLAVSSLHFSVLSFSSTLIVFLVNSGFSMTLITWAEILSAAFELSSTFVFPWAVRVLGNDRTAYHPLPDDETTITTPTTPSRSTFELHDDHSKRNNVAPSSEQTQTTGVSNLGLLSITLTLLTLIPSVPAIWHIATSWPTTTSTSSAWNAHTPLTLLLIIPVSASRLGRFTSALCAQQLAQSRVRPERRAAFAGTDAGLASGFGLAHFAATAVWSRHEEFGWVALGSVGVVAGGVGLYAFWLVGRGRKGGRGGGW